jgi:putative phosphoribosyl transferase
MTPERFSERRYRDRVAAGRVLAAQLAHHAGGDAIVLALPRGGVPVAAEIARALDAPLDLMVVRKLGCPGHRELAAGAIAAGGIKILNPDVADLLDPDDLAAVEALERRELARRERAYRGARPAPSLAGRTVILVDDGLATGATMRAAIAAARSQGPARIVVAVPVGPRDTLATLRREADEVVCPMVPPAFYAIGLWYEDFTQVCDEDVREILARSWGDAAPPAAKPDVVVEARGVALAGLLSVPRDAEGLVIFAHGSGSGRLSPRNQSVARALQENGLATLLFDLLTEAEERMDARTRALRFDIDLLTDRLVGALDWASRQPRLAGLPIGLFGASTGAAAALRAAAARPDQVAAVVSRGGRPDLAGDALEAVRAPTLLIVGGDDPEVLALNRTAAGRLVAPHRVLIVRGATHLFEEPGALDEVARAAAEWLDRWLGRALTHEQPAPPG